MSKVSFVKQAGFTLIELLLYVSIVGVLLISVSLFFALTADSRIKNQSISEVDQQGQAAMEQITQTLRNADSITLPATAATGSQLTLAMATASINPTIYNLNGTALQIKEGNATAVALTNNKVQVTALTFKNLSRTSTPGIVQVSLTLSRVNASGKNEYDVTKTFTSSVSLR